MSEVLFLHQTFTDCMSDQFTHFWYVNMPDVTASYETFLDYNIFCEFSQSFMSELLDFHQTFTDYVSK